MDDSITHILGVDGPIAERLEGYEPRDEQMTMAGAVDRSSDLGAFVC